MENSQLVTGFAEFYRARNAEGETRYFPVSDAKQREVAREFDKAGDPPKVQGYGVYDTEVSSRYAIALYGSEDEARDHGMQQPRTGDQREADTRQAAAQPDTEQPAEAQPAEPAEEKPRKRDRSERSDR